MFGTAALILCATAVALVFAVGPSREAGVAPRASTHRAAVTASPKGYHPPLPLIYVRPASRALLGTCQVQRNPAWPNTPVRVCFVSWVR
jgi:hypothetical protein